jgi:hypothetical protein
MAFTQAEPLWRGKGCMVCSNTSKVATSGLIIQTKAGGTKVHRK